MPSSPNDAALHLRADEKGTEPLDIQVPVSLKRSAIAWSVAFGSGSAAMREAKAAAGSTSVRGISSRTDRVPLVSVPVLSKHTVSTLASPSIAGSSCTNTLRLPSRTTPTAKASEVSSTSP